jgi:hypothetical protein
MRLHAQNGRQIIVTKAVIQFRENLETKKPAVNKVDKPAKAYRRNR